MKINEKIKKFKDQFWDYPNYPFINDNLKKFYKKNYSRLFESCNQLTKAYPIESATFWLELIKSNFALKFLNDIKSIFSPKHEIESIENALKIIKATYENSYHYFAFITICDQYIKKDIKELYKYWYKPNKAKEAPKEIKGNAWKIKKDLISGKYWVLNHCPLLKFSRFDIKIIKKIKDCDSHERLVIKSDKIFLLYDKDPIKLDKEELINIANYLKGTINLCIHFYFSFLIKNKFWLFISLYAINIEKYSSPNIPFHILKDKVIQKSIEKQGINKKDVDMLLQHPVPEIASIVLRYILDGLWNDLHNEVPKLNEYLYRIDLEIDLVALEKLQQESTCDFYNTILLINHKIKQLILNEKSEYQELSINDIEKVDYNSFIIMIKKTVTKIFSMKDQEENIKAIGLIALGFLLIIISPIGRLINNAKHLTKQVIKKDNSDNFR
ncbi:MAG: hypothetical protein H8D22_07495 [Candidatus Cloacimonetes bacterium]|nr:hypothetical protein [Candidatus Cloacimonadota bacterium]